MGVTLSLHQLSIETYIWNAVVIAVVICRFISQYIIRRSWKKFQPDDWLMIFVTCTYTLVIVAVNKFAKISNNINLSTDVEYQMIEARKRGIWNLTTESAMVTTLWGVKATFLICYHRLTQLQAVNKVVKGAAIYCAVGYVVVIICLYAGFCHPFSDYFALHPGNTQCLSWVQYDILQLSFNASSDLLIICIPTSLMLTSQMLWQRKAMLCIVFSLGIFVVICASLTKYFAFISTTNIWVLWYVREASMAMLVGNIFLCLPLLRAIIGTSYSVIGSARSSNGGLTPPMPEIAVHDFDFDIPLDAGCGRDPEK